MARNFCFFIFTCIFNLHYYVPSLLASPIIGGTEDVPFRRYYHVSVHIQLEGTTNYAYLCGGSIIRERHVLSAASCFISVVNGQRTDFDLEKTPTKVIAGTNIRNRGGVTRNVNRIYISMYYKSDPHFQGDLAIILLDRYIFDDSNHNIDFVYVGQVPPSNDIRRPFICGFGFYTGTSNEEEFQILREFSDINRCINVEIQNRFPERQNAARERANAFTEFITATVDSSRTHRSATICPGDGGAGLIINNEILGVLSGHHSANTQDCLSSGLPLHFTSTWHFRNFIRNALEHPERYAFSMYVL